MESQIASNQRKPLILAGISLGIGLGEFFDGMFHVFDYVMTILGVVLLWKVAKRDDVPWSSKTFFGSILMGIGLFDFVEGLIDYQILGVHHVKP